MKIHYTLDDSPARLPLSIRSTDALWDRAAESKIEEELEEDEDEFEQEY